MWCYQKPGFEALLLAELQRQQQCSQFCDIVLKTEGVSVPAHSCILSAISPRISSALSSTTLPPAGQSHLLEFRALGACTLLHLVRLLYSGEMTGEGEKEKQEAFSAAAKLGIHGLVEVTKREEGEGQCAEVGVQTEPLRPEENEGRRDRWRREVRDGSTFLWKETLSGGEKDTWTQTEELQVNTASPSHPAASFETIDIAALQSLGQTDPHLLPISLIYPPDENQTPQLSTAPVWQESTAAGHTSVAVLPSSSQATLSGAGPQGAARDIVEEWEDERFEQFQGDIPGYISYFLNSDKEEGSLRGRARRRRGAGVGGARRVGTGERRASRPQGKGGGRRRGGLMQTVDVQEVGVSKLQKLFLQRSGMRVPRAGQGGGAVGRKLYLKTRELLEPAKKRIRNRRRGKVWEFSQNGDMLPYREGGEGSTQRGRRKTTQKFNQDGPPVGRAQRARAKPTSSVYFSPLPMQFHNRHSLSASSPCLQPSPSPGLLSPAASYVPPASSQLHTTSIPPPAPPPHEEQPIHFDRLLEEVMMGLDILPKSNNNGPPHSQPPVPASSSSLTYASSGITGNTVHGQQVVSVSRGADGYSSANTEVPVLQQQGEGELNEMLEHFLQSFEHHVDSCSREEVEIGGQSSTEASRPYTALRKYRKTKTQTASSQIPELQQKPSQPSQASAHSTVPLKHTEVTQGEAKAPAKRRRRRKPKNEYRFTMERKRVRKPLSSRDAKTKVVYYPGDKQLQKMPVVKLLPVKVTLQGHSCQEAKSPTETKTSSSSVKHPHDSLSDKTETVSSRSLKTYPIRSRIREAPIIMDSMPCRAEPLPGPRQGRPKKNGKLLSLSNGESSTPQIQPQPLVEQLEENEERHEEELTVQPHEEAEGPTRGGEKRGAEEETSGNATVSKRVCFEQTCIPSSDAADFVSEPATIETDDIIDVETVSLTNVGDCSLKEENTEKTVWSEIKLRETEETLMDEEMESSGDEIIDVDGDVEVDCKEADCAQSLSHFSEGNSSVSPPSHSAKEVFLGSPGSREEDIDVIEDCGPIPDPVTISWTECSEGEEGEEDEDVDVVGEITDCASSAFFTAMTKGELVNLKYQTEMLLH